MVSRHSQSEGVRAAQRRRAGRVVRWWCMFLTARLSSDFDGTWLIVLPPPSWGAVRAAAGARRAAGGAPLGSWGLGARTSDDAPRHGRHLVPCHLPGREAEGRCDDIRMVFPGPHCRRAADEGYEICVGAASHVRRARLQPCVLWDVSVWAVRHRLPWRLASHWTTQGRRTECAPHVLPSRGVVCCW